jgi:hypothetical protein
VHVPVVRIYLRAVGHRQQVLDLSAALVIVTVMSFLRCQGPSGQQRRLAMQAVIARLRTDPWRWGNRR